MIGPDAGADAATLVNHAVSVPRSLCAATQVEPSCSASPRLFQLVAVACAQYQSSVLMARRSRRGLTGAGMCKQFSTVLRCVQCGTFHLQRTIEQGMIDEPASMGTHRATRWVHAARRVQPSK